MSNPNRTKIENTTQSMRENWNISDTQKNRLDTLENTYKQEKPINESAKSRHIEEGNEQGRIIETNAEFINQRLEDYINKIHSQEIKRIEEKYGKGLWGKINRWFEETTIGKSIKIGTKVLGGSIATGAALLGSAGMAAPLALSLGARTVVDGVLECVQYWRERNIIEELNDMRSQRVDQAIRLAELRNQILARLNSTPLQDKVDIVSNNPANNYERELQQILDETAQVEEIILRQEKNLNLSQKRWKIGRFIAGLATTGATIAYTGIYGIKTGIQDLDKLNPTNIPGIGSGNVPYPAGIDPSQAQAALTPTHETRVYLNGLNFIYNNSDKIARGANVTQIERAGGVLSHLVEKGWIGKTIPKSLYASVATSLAGIIGTTTKEVYDMIKLDKISKKDLDAAILSVRNIPRNTIGGSNQEIATGQSAIIEKENKFFLSLSKNEIWSINGNPISPNTSDPENFYQINSLDKDRNEIKIQQIDKTTGQTQGNEITLNSRQMMQLQNTHSNYYKKIGSSFESYKASQSEKAKSKWNEWLENNHIATEFGLTVKNSNLLRDKNNRFVEEDKEWIIEKIDPEKEIVVISRKPDSSDTTRIKKQHIISLENIKNILENPAITNSIEIGEISKETQSSTIDNLWQDLSKKLFDKKKIPIEKDFKNKKSIFEYDDEYWTIINVTDQDVILRKVDEDNLKYKTGSIRNNTETISKNDFVNDSSFLGETVRK